ncbi:biopolymer transporter ExbD [Mucilaginibacter mali]|uniref:Biopolymer transporter ExbD n=1 Tax=Mucilaginibacter mali TaxID=2740462 RepID=A0A7D4QB68_9SPHI|nr:biopolymer transporter ExbD [Mucilaginibacter mali]QKJ32431.1 biopolymer transporter ExbD [Mucilaginibacter mali]
MAIHKFKKTKLGIDMTAMCDVAFILVVFLVLTAKPRSIFSDRINLPAASLETSDPDGGIAEIIINKGKCYFSVEGDIFKKELLTKVGRDYGLMFSEQESNKFSRMDAICTPIEQLRSFVHNYHTPDDIFEQDGIPVDSTKANELMQWVIAARNIEMKHKERELKFAIVCDKDEPYPVVKLIMDDLRSIGINKFSLVHNTRTANNYY